MIHITRRLAPSFDRLGIYVAAGASILVVAPTGPGLTALGLLLALSVVVRADVRRPKPRFTGHRRLLETARFRAWRAWDTERQRGCVLVSTTPAAAASGAAALADARRVLAVGPAYDTARDAHGPLWVFEA